VITDEGRAPGAGPDEELVRLINLQRERGGLVPLEPDARLAKAASAHSQAMARHGCVEFECGGHRTDARLSRNGYRAGMSRFYVSAGKATPEEMIREIMGSAWGRNMVLDPGFRHIAARHVATDSVYRHYWAIGFAAPAVEDLDILSATVLRLVNEEREKQGAPALVLSRELAASAQFHAEFMAENDCYEHRCPGEPNLARRARNAGYEWQAVAENIGAGYPDPEAAVAGWMDSPGHRRNILDPRFREIGIGYVLLDRDGGEERWRHYWVQNFGVR
jgi:uncharacterized protein YkwD